MTTSQSDSMTTSRSPSSLRDTVTLASRSQAFITALVVEVILPVASTAMRRHNGCALVRVRALTRITRARLYRKEPLGRMIQWMGK